MRSRARAKRGAHARPQVSDEQKPYRGCSRQRRTQSRQQILDPGRLGRRRCRSGGSRSSSLTSFGSTVATPAARAGAGGTSPAAATGDAALAVAGAAGQAATAGAGVFGPLGLSGRRRHRRRRSCGRIDRLLLHLRLCRLGAGRSARCCLARSSVVPSRPDASPHAHPGAVPRLSPSCAPVRLARPWPAPRSSPARPTRSGTESDRCRRPAHVLNGRPVSTPAAVVTTAKARKVCMYPPVPKRWMRLYAWVVMASD